jgi:ATP-dependent 26S proteasome regulatory subunit
VNTQEITTRINKFFSKIDVYKKYGFAVAKRGILLYGPAGTGKSVSINKICTEYGQDGKTLVLIWNTDKYEAHHVKDFIKGFEYVGVERMILVAEDIGGTEIDQSRMRSDSSLLSLLDNQEKTFTKPILILATTNYPENFMGNLTNRPNRFDDKIKVGYPEAQARVDLLKFFDDNFVTADDMEFFKQKKFEKFSPAHIREVIVRSAIYDKTIQESITEIYKEIQNYEKAFQDTSKLGL